MSDASAASSLEQLLADGKVEAALLLKGDYTAEELELARRAFEAGFKLGKESRES